MKKINLVYVLIFLLTLFACNNDEDVICNECDGRKSEQIYMLVSGEQVYCNDETEEYCIRVKFGEVVTNTEYGYNQMTMYQTSESYEVTDDEWNIFDNEICGFTFNPGYEYELKIEKKKYDEPVDGKEYKYCLLNIISTTRISL